MNVAVFGASGVIGTALLPLLVRENHVVAVSRTAQPPTSRNPRYSLDARRRQFAR